MMSTENNVQRTTEQAAYALQVLLAEEWAEWVGYLLEALEEGADDEEYRGFLEALELAIITRLEEGSW